MMRDEVVTGMTVEGAIELLEIYGVHVSNHAIRWCGPHTGHSVRDIAFCESRVVAAAIAELVAAGIRSRELPDVERD